MRAASPSSEPPAGPDAWSRTLFWAALVVGLTVFVRLGEWSLWIDEVFTLTDSLNQSVTDNPVGYVVFGWFYRTLLELGGRPDEWGLRILPAVFGWLGVPLTYWAFRRAAGARVAAAAALLLAVSSWHRYWAQNARFYTLVQDLVLLGSGFGLRGLFPAPGARRVPLLLGGLFFFGLATLAHPTAGLPAAAFVLAPLAVAAAGRSVPGARALLGGGVGKLLIGVGALGLIAVVIWGGPIYQLWVRNKGGGTPLHLILTLGFFVTPLLGAAALFGVADALRRRSTFGLTASLVVILGTLAAALVAFFARMTAQYMFAFLPWFCLLAALPLAGLKSGRERFLGAGLLGVLVLSGLVTEGLYLTVRAGERPHWREAYRYVWNHRGPEDQIFGMAGEVGQYYLDPAALDLRRIEGLSYLNKWGAGAVRRWAREDRRSWFVLNREELKDWSAKDRTDMETMLATDCRLVASWPLFVESRDLSVEVYLRE